jgi:hypothetical protein
MCCDFTLVPAELRNTEAQLRPQRFVYLDAVAVAPPPADAVVEQPIRQSWTDYQQLPCPVFPSGCLKPVPRPPALEPFGASNYPGLGCRRHNRGARPRQISEHLI